MNASATMATDVFTTLMEVHNINIIIIASFPGLPTVQILITYIMRKWMVGRPGNETNYYVYTH